MTGLLILIVVLQAVIVAWMVFITMLIYAHDSEIKALNGLYRKVDEYAERIEQIVDETANDKRFALETIQQARRLQGQVDTKLQKQSETFKFDEKEEDPEEPRS